MSAVDVRIGDRNYFNISDFAVTVDSTPTRIGDMTGGGGDLRVTIPESDAILLIHKKDAILTDPTLGELHGNLRASGSNGVNATLSGFTISSKLNVDRIVPPFAGTLSELILFYTGLCGIPASAVEIFGGSTFNAPLRVIGWEGNMLDKIKDLCAAEWIEMAAVGDKLTFRPIGAAGILDTMNWADASWTADEGELAQKISAARYTTQPLSTGVHYPPGGWNEDVPIFSVGAGETTIYEIDLAPTDAGPGVSFLTIQQPVCVLNVPVDYSGSQSVYAVAGSDGVPIPPAQWTAGGGKIELELKDGGNRIIVTITGAADEEYAPYDIAMTSGTSDAYSSLRIRGLGIPYNRCVVEMHTGVDPDYATQEEAPLVDNIFLTRHDQTYNRMLGLLVRHSTAARTLTGTLDKPKGAGDIDTQAYGNVEGSLVMWGDAALRVRTMTANMTATTVTAEHFGFVQQELLTAAQWNAKYPAGTTADELAAMQVRGDLA